MELFATFLTWQEGCGVVVILPKHPFHFKPLCEVYLVPVVRWLLLLWWSGGSTFCPDTFPCLWHEWVSQGSDYGASINKQINMFPSRSHFTQSCLECSGLSILHILPHLAEQLSIGNAEYILKNGAGILVSGCQSFGQQEHLWDNWISQLSSATLPYPHTKPCTPQPSRLLFVGQKIGLTRGCVCTAMGPFLFLVSASYIESALSLRLGAQALWS